MGESWKLLTVQFTFTAVTLTFVVFIFVNVNIAMDELNVLIPRLQDAFDSVPSIQTSMETASTGVFEIEERIGIIASSLQNNLNTSVESIDEKMDG